MDSIIVELEKNKKKDIIKYDFLPTFNLLCTKYGINTKLTNNKSKINITEPTEDFDNIILKSKDKELCNKIVSFLSQAGIEIEKEDSKDNINIEIEFKVKNSIKKINTNIYINDKSKVLAKNIKEELKKLNINCNIIKNIKTDDADCKIKFTTPTEVDKKFKDEISFYISSAILNYIYNKSPLYFLKKIPEENFNTFLNALNLVKENKTETGSAEVYLDYNTIISKNNENILTIVNIKIKNTGTESLYNPRVCISINPKEIIKISGQIVPPNMLSALSVYNGEDKVGWKYAEEDWLKIGKETGKYWIEPIEDMEIKPNSTESCCFQASILQKNLEKNQLIAIDCDVEFKEQELKVSSNNKIAITILEEKEK